MFYQGVKFQTEFLEKKAPKDKRLEELKYWCMIFHNKNLCPPYEGGSYGNMSFRLTEGSDEFIITGSRIGMKADLDNHSFVHVKNCDLVTKTIYASGCKEPSSETMLHWSLYKARPEVNAIFHGHSAQILKNTKNLELPTTSKEEPYGSVALVEKVLDCVDDLNFIIMKNHGFIALGRNMTETGEITLTVLKKCS
jgi:L-fuculose-phosphate aldolase